MKRILCVSRMDLFIYNLLHENLWAMWNLVNGITFLFRFLRNQKIPDLFSRRKNSNVCPQKISVIFKNKCISMYMYSRFLDFKTLAFLTPQLKTRPPSRCYTAVCIWLEQTKPNGLRGRSKTTLTRRGR